MTNECQNSTFKLITKFKATSKNVIPAKAEIQKLLTILDSRLRGSDKLVIIRGVLKLQKFGVI